MGKVQLGPASSVIGGAVGLALLAAGGRVTVLGALAGIAYLLVSNLLLARGLHRRRAQRFGWANAATAARSTLVALVTALAVTGLDALLGALLDPARHAVPVQLHSPALLVGLTAPALALDAVDGWLARRTGSATELGARFDMEVDAWLILVLSAVVAPTLGAWTLVIGLLRYAFVAAGWMLPWLRGPLPARYWRKVVAAVQGIVLAVAASGVLPLWLSASAVAVALVLLVESFSRDILWLYRRQRPTPKAIAMNTSVTAKPTR